MRTFVAVMVMTAVIALGLAGQNAPFSESLTNEAVIQLLQGGLSADVVAAKIRATRNRKFNTEPEELLRLKAANVPDSVILAMVEPPPDFVKARVRDLISAKRVYLQNESKPGGVFDELREKIKKWGRWQIVDKSEEADIILVYSANSKWMMTGGGGGLGLGGSFPRYLSAIHPISGVPLVTVSSEDMMSAGWTARRMVDRMRKKIEELERQPPSVDDQKGAAQP